MNERDLTIAHQLKTRIEAIARLIDFRIFGSRARGDADEYSDLDVFIEIDRIDEAIERGIRDAVWEVGFENDVYISPLIFSRQEVEETALRSSPIIKNIAREGVPV